MRKLVSVRFPYLDVPQQTKVRPALCLTKPLGKHQIVIIAFITTQHEDILPTDVVLDTVDEAFVQTGLKRPSVIRLHKLTSVTVESIQGEIGTLSASWEQEVQKKLTLLFNL